jgi:hypothetical protein
MREREDLIHKLVGYNLELCQTDTSFADGLVWDLLMHGFKGFKNMDEAELLAELKHCDFDERD